MDYRAHRELHPVAAHQDIRVQSHRLVRGTQKGTPVHSEGVNVPVPSDPHAQGAVLGGKAEPVAVGRKAAAVTDPGGVPLSDKNQDQDAERDPIPTKALEGVGLHVAEKPFHDGERDN